MSDLLSTYQAQLKKNLIKPDPAQAEIMQHLAQWAEEQNGTPSWFASFFAKKTSPKNIYLYGGVGRGKTMMMDLCFAHLTNAHKQRYHFHAFMLQLHEKIHALRGRKRKENLLPTIIKAWFAKGSILCLDELLVHDITDAMILDELFRALAAQEVSIITTSNTAPGNLYKDGLQRARFMPVIERIEQDWQVLPIQDGTDYRLQALQAVDQLYVHPLGQQADRFLERLFNQLSGNPDAGEGVLKVKSRSLNIHRLCADIAWFTFAELCEKPRGNVDYLEIACNYHTVLLSDIPQMGKEHRNEIKRFINLVDTLYDHKVKLILTAAVPVESIYTEGQYKDSFERTLSRLIEMQSKRYLHKAHVG